MRVTLMGFDFVVRYRPGKSNPADWSSRHPETLASEEHQEIEDYVNMVIGSKNTRTVALDDVKRETQEDEILQKVVYSVKQQEPLGKEVGVKAYASVMSELSVIDGVLLRAERLVVPEKLQEKTARMPLKMTPLPNERMEKIAADFYGPLPTGEYLLLVTCKYARWIFIEVVNSTAARSVIPKLERIYSEFGYPSEIMADNGPLFRSQEFRDYAAECGFQVRNITPAEPKVNGQAERFIKNITKTVQTAMAKKGI
ncbi:Retrovirus-related Pol poly from transposon [Paramuricea clavata]|uniref:Retrovirus-related Pol poly from transposon n=1 Tax=Paramuricea clavata TaxID=317549 RepID=A0A7D9JFG4_PARCT|nr:Retrovirus-related Pol poly from transposon [Paramuricea clavata]